MSIFRIIFGYLSNFRLVYVHDIIQLVLFIVSVSQCHAFLTLTHSSHCTH